MEAKYVIRQPTAHNWIYLTALNVCDFWNIYEIHVVLNFADNRNFIDTLWLPHLKKKFSHISNSH